MSKRVMAIVVGAIAVLLMAALGSATASAQELTYSVTIEQLTDGQPFTPPALVAQMTSAS